MSAPMERPELDHAARAADHMLALVVTREPAFQVTAEMHDATVELVHAVVSALVVGGAR